MAKSRSLRLGVLVGYISVGFRSPGKSMSNSRSATFFSKQLDYEGIKIRASRQVSDKALKRAHQRLAMMLGRTPTILTNLENAGVELHVIGRNENTSDLPENHHWKNKPFDGNQTIDQRTRGVGGRYASCGEENLLRLKRDRYRGYDICIHEFAHSIFEHGLSADVRERIGDRYRKSVANRKWKGAYATRNENEFFAELSMWYFGSRGDFGEIEPAPEPGSDWLLKYDKLSYRLIDEIYSGKISVAAIRAPLLLKPMTPCLEGSVKSPLVKSQTMVSFVNNRASEVKVHWLDYDGERRLYATVSPSLRYDQPSFKSHAWLVTDKRGKGLVIFIANARSSRPQIAAISAAMKFE
jgi:VHL beta domain